MLTQEKFDEMVKESIKRNLRVDVYHNQINNEEADLEIEVSIYWGNEEITCDKY